MLFLGPVDSNCLLRYFLKSSFCRPSERVLETRVLFTPPRAVLSTCPGRS